jgi:hypothetical protein
MFGSLVNHSSGPWSWKPWLFSIWLSLPHVLKIKETLAPLPQK